MKLQMNERCECPLPAADHDAEAALLDYWLSLPPGHPRLASATLAGPDGRELLEAARRLAADVQRLNRERFAERRAAELELHEARIAYEKDLEDARREASRLRDRLQLLEARP